MFYQQNCNKLPQSIIQNVECKKFKVELKALINEKAYYSVNEYLDDKFLIFNVL